jgi:hypothetical protein
MSKPLASPSLGFKIGACLGAPRTIGHALLAAAFSLPIASKGELVRADYEFNSQFTRYTDLANQARFDTVGALTLSSPTLSGLDCTGTLISATVVLTAAHCFATPRGFLFTPSQSLFTGGFSTGVSVNFIGGPATSAASRTYFGTADSVAIFPGYNGLYESGDLALVRVSQFNGNVPTNYLAINTSPSVSSPAPNFAVTVGYGNLGNGVSGEAPNPTNLKVAGITTIQDVAAGPTLLKSTFLSPSQIFQAGYPINFLQSAPGYGDSGGPLVLNIAGVQSIIGTVGGGGVGTRTLFEPKTEGDFYGQDNFWVRTSSFAGWIASESAALGGSAILGVAGSSEANPVYGITTNVNGANGPFTRKNFAFLTSLGFEFVDPPGGRVDQLTVVDGPKLTGVRLSSNISDVQFSIFDDVSQSFGALSALIFGQDYFFSATDKIEVFGLNGNQTVLGLKFASVGVVDLQWDSLPDAVAAVPEPSTYAYFAVGLAVVGLARRRRIEIL